MAVRHADSWLVLAVLIFLAFDVVRGESPKNDPASNVGVQIADLRQQLEAGLQVWRPEDVAFINRVVVMVRRGQLPLEMVKSTFAWARTKESYPFLHFQYALRTRAAKAGIRITVPHG